MTPTADDYEWVNEWRGWVTAGYCLTTVKDVSPCEVLDRLGASDLVDGLTLDDVERGCWDAWERTGGARCFVGITSAVSAAVMVEVNGFVGVTEALVAPVSRGTEVVAHYRNVNAVDRFLWMADQVVKLEFEPLFPSTRSGPSADEIESLMRRVGFDLDETDERLGRTVPPAFALAEALTGVRVTASLLSSSRFVGGLVAPPFGTHEIR